MQPHHRTNHNDVFWLIILITITLASSNNMFPDDGYWTETCRSSFHVNFNIRLKQLYCASFGKYKTLIVSRCTVKVKVIPQQVEVSQGVPGRLRPRNLLRFGTTRVVGRQPYAPAAVTPGEIPGTHFQRLNRPQGTWFRRGSHGKKSPVTPPGIDPGTVRLVAQCLNHYATLGPQDARYNYEKKLKFYLVTKNKQKML